MSKGFTLIEILVALTIFVTIFFVTSGYLIAAISGQRQYLRVQPLVNEGSFFAEYLSRALRPAQRETADPPACLSQTGLYYESASPEVVRFIDRDEKCREISYDSAAKRVFEKISTDNTKDFFGPLQALTSSSLAVENLQFQVSNPPSQTGIPHPRVTFTVELESIGGAAAQAIRLQTTISQREF